VVVQTFYEVRKLFDVSRSCFVPNPEVDSVVIEMKRKAVEIDLSQFKKFVSMIFSKKERHSETISGRFFLFLKVWTFQEGQNNSASKR
jgi:16S rRNA A1518/A1519 N6-dimethyltransferase RsmA/KsgA/DIM1 with predicted DNA glycosylase/AP lyase activity